MSFSESTIGSQRNLDKALRQAAQTIEPYRPPKEALRALIGKRKQCEESIGTHPDFALLNLGDTENHYIVSVFTDIQGSTVLGTKLPLENVRFIKNGILTSAIDIYQAFDGHVHRLQGDAIFTFFGRKDMEKVDSIIDALNACSILQQFCHATLAPIFEKQGFPSVKLRIGIDFGDDSQVLWSHYGIKDCNEITTTSIHTDLASKMQSKAPANGIMIGENIRVFLDIPDEFYSIKKKRRDDKVCEDRYIIENSYLTYPMWLFDWKRYLNRFILFEHKTPYTYKTPQNFSYMCFCKYPEQVEYKHKYRSNCGALPKNVDLKFVLEIPSYIRYQEIEWRVINRGEEATIAQQLNFVMKDYGNKTICFQKTAYKGHHYMVCTIKYQGRIIAQEYFGVYVSA